MTDMEGKLDLEKLRKYRQGMRVIEMKRPETLRELGAGEKMYTMTYPGAGSERKKELDRYFSDRILYNYYYVNTDANGDIVELFWDKP